MPRVAVITGGTSGIGAEYANRFAELGYDLMITGRREKRIQEFARDLRQRFGREVKVLIADFASEHARSDLIREVSSTEGVEVLVNNAGFGLSAPFGGAAIDGQMAMIDVHVRTTLELTAAVLPGMKRRGGGIIINVASVAAFFPMPGSALYSATKSFLVAFTESVSMELSNQGIRVQVVCPGLTHTDFHERMGEEGKRIMERRLVPWMSSRRVVRSSLRAVKRKRVVFIPGATNTMLVRLLSHLPRKLYHALIVKALPTPLSRTFD